MSHVGLVVVEKTLGGELFSNTYAFSNGDPHVTGPFTTADIEAIIGDWTGTLDQATSIDYTDPPAVPTSAIVAAVGFDRRLTAQNVVYTRAYLSDGKTVEGQPKYFATYPLGFTGLYGIALAGIAPLSLVAQINRNPEGFSSRAGRILMRAVFGRDDVTFGTRDGVTFTGDGRTQMQARLTDAVNKSGLNSFIQLTELSSAVQFVIPHYLRTTVKAENGIIESGTSVESLTLGDAISRQVPRGRKRKTV